MWWLVFALISEEEEAAAAATAVCVGLGEDRMKKEEIVDSDSLRLIDIN